MRINVHAHCKTENPVLFGTGNDVKEVDFGTTRRTNFIYEFCDIMLSKYLFQAIEEEARKRLLSNLTGNSKEKLVGKIYIKFSFEIES